MLLKCVYKLFLAQNACIVFQWVTGLRMFTLDIFQLWEVTFICRGNQGTWIKQQTCCKSLYHITLFYSVPLQSGGIKLATCTGSLEVNFFFSR